MTSYAKLMAIGSIAAQEPARYPDGGYPSEVPFTEEQYRKMRADHVADEIASVNTYSEPGGWLLAAIHRLWAAGQNSPPYGSYHHASLIIADALHAIMKKMLADDYTPISPTSPFVWVEDGENAGAPKWLLKYGDYVGKVNKGFGDSKWSYRVDHSGRLGFETADEAKAAAEADLKERLHVRLKAAKRTLEVFAEDGNVVGS